MTIRSTLPRRLLGRELRDLRGKAGISMEVARAAISVGKQSLWRLETGQPVKLRHLDIERLCQVYGAPQEKTDILLGLTDEAEGKGWWHGFGGAIPKHYEPFVGLEQFAVRVTTYQSSMVPELLQIADYRRTLTGTGFPDVDSAEVERRVELAARRQDRLTDETNPLSLNVVLDELPLRRLIGGPDVMAAQLRHIADTSRLTNVSVRVVPASVGTDPGWLIGSFVLMEFPRNPTAHLTEPPVVYVPGYAGALYLEKPEEVRQYRDGYARLERAALNEDDSHHLIVQIAGELACAATRTLTTRRSSPPSSGEHSPQAL